MVGSAGRTDIDPVGAAAELVAATGAAVLPAPSVTRSLGVGREEWTRFARDPLLHKVIRLLSRIAAGLDEVGEWNVQVHPFRIRSAPQQCGAGGQPTPDGRRLLTATLAEPGTLLVSDDRRTLHQVSPIRPLEGDGPARRDVLVVTFASGRP